MEYVRFTGKHWSENIDIIKDGLYFFPEFICDDNKMILVNQQHNIWDNYFVFITKKEFMYGTNMNEKVIEYIEDLMNNIPYKVKDTAHLDKFDEGIFLNENYMLILGVLKNYNYGKKAIK